MRMTRKNSCLLSLVALTLLSGCSMYQEGTLTESRVQVKEENFAEEIPISQFDVNVIAGMSQHYRKHGDGPLHLTVSYDPHSQTNTAMNASNHMARMVRDFKSNGVHDVAADILPVQGQGDDGMVVVSYTSYTAAAPDDCGVLPGFEDTIVDQNEEYRIGCTLERMYARQAAHPRDLMGRGSDGSLSDGRRASNMGEMYRGGLGNKALEGESASE
jgi:type IV pilus biogenesis protein CpaD/CtpE